LARGLYAFRSVNRSAYGRLEVGVAFVAAYSTIHAGVTDADGTTSLSAVLSLTSACYIGVRGYDNLRQGELLIEALAHRVIPGLTRLRKTYAEWAGALVQQHKDFQEYRSDSPMKRDEQFVTGTDGKEFTVTVSPWWYDKVGGDILIQYVISNHGETSLRAEYTEVIAETGKTVGAVSKTSWLPRL
jgi:hypothetical protein